MDYSEYLKETIFTWASSIFFIITCLLQFPIIMISLLLPESFVIHLKDYALETRQTRHWEQIDHIPFEQ